eukprot:CAMPEP_0185029722 /NCGR_PEP_ID=MMETSP1103-20130426/16197_1 /TAXON_ID=36769 /ORGANISM="Paraphysomonas bandaiensis, Strain Caron Lab Isolate" /LENGTH=486 /DNA_ID=CAMNT_0027564567 /DNA_START=109 /DNA_END=1569 /DNA_ORIENTATION=-
MKTIQRGLDGTGDPDSAGDTAWILTATVLVLLMTTPGIMLYYAGMVRLQNVLSTAMQGYSIMCVVTFLWMCFGYSLAFAPADSENINAVIFGDSSRFWLNGLKMGGSHQMAPTIPESVFCVFQLSFAVITPSLICGAFADRMKFTAVLVSLGLWHLIVYCPIAHANWHPNGFLYKAGVLDFAGGNVVHISAGMSALVSAIIIGKRTGFGKSTFHPHNMLVSLTGSCFLLIGWYGFNAGSALAANALSGLAMLNTQIASGVASVTWMFHDIFVLGKPTVEGIMNGCIAGLVAITPAAGFVNPTGAFVIGVVGGIACAKGVRIKDYFDFDDALDAFGIHAIGGVVGGLMLGLLATSSVNGEDGAFYGDNGKQLSLQLYGIVITIVWSIIGTGGIMLLVDKTLGLRVSPQSELAGLDRTEHGSTLDAQMVNVPKRRKTEGLGVFYCCCCVIGDVAGAKEKIAAKKAVKSGGRTPSKPAAQAASAAAGSD